MTERRRITKWDHFKAALGMKGAVTYYGPESVSGEGFLQNYRWWGQPTSAGVCVSEAIALNLPVVWACIARISDPIATVPIKIVREEGNKTRTVTDHPLTQLLGLRPNEWMNSRTFRKTIQAHALIWGNGYVEIQRRNNGEIVALWPWLPWDTHLSVDESGLLYETQIDGRRYNRRDPDMLHILDFSADGYCGLSPIMRAGAGAVGLAIAAETFGSKFFQNDARGGGFLMHPAKLGPNAVRNIQDSMAAESGLKNAHRIKVLEEGMKFIDTQIPPEAAQFLGTRQFQIAEIARIYNVPLIMLQENESTTAWGSGIEQLMIGFVQQTLAPWCVAWEHELNFKLLTENERKQGLQIKFNLNGLLRGDMAARANFYQALFSMGAISPNWINAKEDEEIDLGENGDQTFIQVNMQTLDMAVNPPEPPPAVIQGGAGTKPPQPAPAEDAE